MSKERILFIVESPNKVKSINTILREAGLDNYVVQASVGHISCINDSGLYNMGIDPKTFDIDFKISDDKRDTVRKLKEQVAMASKVILASDDDREGEAIAWSLKKFLNIPDKKYERITYHEITKNAILKALNNPRKIDEDLVKAAHTRSRLDKIVGYRLSPVARNNTQARSVGRCQSAGLKLVVDREKEIQNFTSTTFYELYLNFSKGETNFKAKYLGTEKEECSKFTNKEDCYKISSECAASDYLISDIIKKELKQGSPLPFTTSTFQQEVANRLGLSVKEAMNCAQRLFEGVDVNGKHQALITYIRTDDATLAPEFIEVLKDYIIGTFGKDYLAQPKQAKKADNVQAGHEAIRPVDLNIKPQDLKRFALDEKLIKVYDIIYGRTIASLMQPRIIADTQYIINNGKHRFGLSSKEQLFDGWKAVYNYQDDKEDAEPIVKEVFTIGEPLQNTTLEVAEKHTNPPARYTEASLIKTLDKLGIGRPSTYATIVSTLLDPKRNYCVVESKKLVPTELAIKLVDFLDEKFPDIVNSDYTANLEKSLDKIAEGKLEDIDFLTTFYTQLDESIKKVAPQRVDKKCPECGSPLVMRKGKFGPFLGCSNYPNCHHIEKITKK